MFICSEFLSSQNTIGQYDVAIEGTLSAIKEVCMKHLNKGSDKLSLNMYL